MANEPAQHPVQRRNGHPTIGVTDGEEMEPKGLPTSDRYQAETTHSAETDDHTDHARTTKSPRGK
jgi:hypothetical protein